jgi:glycosyltransferase involved in cell wall biosynthesis
MLGTARPMLLLEPGQAAQACAPEERREPRRRPLISCIMASRGNPYPAGLAIDCFRRQSYAERELVIITAATDGALRDLVETLADPAIRLIQADAGAKVGDLRNAAIAESDGDLLCIWDDDDLSHPDRLALQYRAMRDARAQGCFLARVLLWWPARQMLAVSCLRTWENTMLVERSRFPSYPGDQPRGEDTYVAEALRTSHRLILHDVPEAYCYVAHGDNLWHEEHFEMLFRVASRSFNGAAYTELLAGLSAALPIADYAEGLSRG